MISAVTQMHSKMYRVFRDVSGKTLPLDANGYVDGASYKRRLPFGEPPAAGLSAGGIEDVLPASDIIAITGGQLQILALRAKSAYLQAFAAANTVLAACGINKTKLRLRHFMAQVLDESDGFTGKGENMNCSAEGMMEVWPKRFPTLESAQPYAQNREKLANFVFRGVVPVCGWGAVH